MPFNGMSGSSQMVLQVQDPFQAFQVLIDVGFDTMKLGINNQNIQFPSEPLNLVATVLTIRLMPSPTTPCRPPTKSRWRYAMVQNNLNCQHESFTLPQAQKRVSERAYE